MGIMIEGTFHADEGNVMASEDGRFRRAPSVIRHWITPNGDPGPSGDGGFVAEPGRYHLYVSWGCPWAHRTLLARKLKRLEPMVGVSFARPGRDKEGWAFDAEGEFSDPVNHIGRLHELYSRGADRYTGRITVPFLWDAETGRAVNNESADIVRMFNTAFNTHGAAPIDLYPADLAEDIEAWNERIYNGLNNGVYRAGFAATQEAYEEAVTEVFETLDAMDAQLARTRYLTGDRFTEADLRAFPTLARFDVAYHYAFKCNLRRLSDYDHVWPYAREIYQMPGVAETVNFERAKRGYHSMSELRNPLGIVPVGPIVDWDEPHGRG